MMWRPRTGDIKINHSHEKQVAPIIADGAIARVDLGEGRVFPLVILDTSLRPDIDAAIAAHAMEVSGDVRVQWGQLLGRKDTVLLALSCVRPSEVVIMVEFDLAQHHGILVDGALTNHGLYVQAGRPGDRLKHDIERPKMFVELPDTGFAPIWERIYLSYTDRRFRRAGLSRMAARRAARNAVAMARSVSEFRPWGGRRSSPSDEGGG